MTYNQVQQQLQQVQKLESKEAQLQAQHLILSNNTFLQPYEILSLLFERLLDETVAHRYMTITLE